MVTRRQAEEEAEEVRLQHNVVPGRSAFLLEGISIENMQCVSSPVHRRNSQTLITASQTGIEENAKFAHGPSSDDAAGSTHPPPPTYSTIPPGSG